LVWEKENIDKKHLQVLYHLFSWDEVGEDKTQLSLFNLYNFNIIPIELISEIYEQFMWEKQDKNSAYYTPSFLVDYILEKTVKKHLEKNKNCRVFDPSCGSWIFLVESLRQIIENNIDNLNRLEKISPINKIDELKNIVENNIFWVDKDEQAISITIFSLCLTMLDYTNPKDITLFKFPTLKNKDWKWWKNLFVSDFFDLDNSFNNQINDIDFILWNPPWWKFSNKIDDKNHLEYIKIIEKRYWNRIIDNNQIAQSFLLRTKDFSNKSTKISLILPSKSILYNYNALKFRDIWLKNFIITEILELSPVRKKLFVNAIPPTFIAFFRSENDIKKIENNIVIHNSIKPNIFLDMLKILVIEKNDIKEIQQKYFIKYKFLWKVLLYWNVLDFNLIRRLKEDYKNINHTIEENKLISWWWIQIWWWDKIDSTKLIWKTFLDVWPSKKALDKFYINDKILDKFKLKFLHRIRNEKLFDKWPKILLKEWLSKSDFSICSVYTENDYVFSKSITAVCWENKNILKSISWIINLDFGKYFLLQQWSYLWIEREIITKEDFINLPVIESKEIANLVDNIQEKYIFINKFNLTEDNINKNQLKLENQILEDKKVELEKEKNNLESKLNKLVLNSFNLSEIEKDLLNYTNDITIPLINNKKWPFNEVWKVELKKYTQIFLDYFWETWNGKDWKFFEIDIYMNKYLVWINFKVVKEKRKEKIHFNNNEDIFKEMSNLIELWEEKVTDTFYEQRDIRWFNKKSFYIVKYNQAKNWHKAVWQADLSEFISAIMKWEQEVYKDKN
jgi:hypothetical protein